MNKDKKKGCHDGHIRRRKDGRLEGVITVESVTKSFYGKTEAEIRRKMKEFKKQVLAKQINPKTDLLEDYCRKWIYQNKFGKVEPSYYDRMETVVENQIVGSKISKKQFGKIKPEEIEQFLDDLATPVNQEMAYSYSTIKKVYELLSMIYADAFNKGLIVINPMKSVGMPKRSRCVVESKEMFSLSDDEIQRFKEQCLIKTKAGHYKYRGALFLLLILNTGMRVGEALALTFNEVNLNERYILINKSLQSNVKTRNNEVTKRVSIIKEPKTKKSVRYLPINDEIYFIISEIMKDNERRNIQASYVCSTEKGTRGSARNLQRTLDIITKNAGLPHMWLHLLRHIYGSVLIRKGVDVTVVSRLMGHASTNITYYHYIHVIEEQMVKAMRLTSVS